MQNAYGLLSLDAQIVSIALPPSCRPYIFQQALAIKVRQFLSPTTCLELAFEPIQTLERSAPVAAQQLLKYSDGTGQ
jgi:hypothetical protein